MSDNLFDVASSNSEVDEPSKNPVASPDPSQADVNPSTSEWYLADGVKGNGEAPPWYNAKTFKSVAEQAKAHPELRKKLSEMGEKYKNFSGAPENDYELKLNEDLANISADEKFVNSFKEKAKEMNMSEEGFNELANLWAGYEKTMIDSINDKKIEEVKKIGSNAGQQLNELKTWFVQNFGEEELPGFMDSIHSAATFKAWKKAMEKSHAAPIPTQQSQAESLPAEYDLRQMLNNPDYVNNSPGYRKKIDDLYKQKYGKSG